MKTIVLKYDRVKVVEVCSSRLRAIRPKLHKA